MNRLKIWALCAFVFFFVGVSMVGVASAATYTLLAQISDEFDLTTGDSVAPLPGMPATNPVANTFVPNQAQEYQYKVDLYLQTGNFAAGQRGFANIAWSIKFNGNDGNNVPTPPQSLYANDSTSPGSQGQGYNGDSSVIDTNGGSHTTGTTALWGDNSDFGDPSDMTGIVSSIAVIPSPNVNDPRPFVGQTLTASQSADVTGVNPALTKQDHWSSADNRTYLGTIFVDWDGIGVEHLDFQIDQSSYVVSSDGSFQLDTGQGNALVQNNAHIVWGTAIPEPSSIVLLGLAIPAFVLVARRRRQR